MSLLQRTVDRVLPTTLMVLSLTFLAVGLLSFASSTPATPRPTTLGVGDPRPSFAASPSLTAPSPRASASLRPSASPESPSDSPGRSLPATLPPASPPSSSPSPAPAASRIRIPSLAIDLPIVPGDLDVPGNVDDYPLCDVAMFLTDFVQPGQPGTTYIYAHAQRGMFLPLLRASEVDDGASMVGALVEVYSADGQLHLYEISQVKRHATDLSITDLPPGSHQLVLQTSEGPTGTIPKLQVAARSLGAVVATPEEANPVPRPRVCLPG